MTPEEAGTMSADNNILNINWNEDFRGMANIEVKLSNGCGESEISEALEVLVKNTYSVEENTGEGISIYPNPARNQISIAGIAEAQIEICNPLGQVLMQAKINGIEPVDISELQPGIYFIRSNDSGKVYLKFIKQ